MRVSASSQSGLRSENMCAQTINGEEYHIAVRAENIFHFLAVSGFFGIAFVWNGNPYDADGEERQKGGDKKKFFHFI